MRRLPGFRSSIWGCDAEDDGLFECSLQFADIVHGTFIEKVPSPFWWFFPSVILYHALSSKNPLRQNPDLVDEQMMWKAPQYDNARYRRVQSESHVASQPFSATLSTGGSKARPLANDFRLFVTPILQGKGLISVLSLSPAEEWCPAERSELP